MAEPIDKDTRGPVNLRIKFRSESLQQFIERYGVDVSRGGIFIRTREPLPVGTRLKLDFQLVDTVPLFQGDGTVVWIREHDPARAGVTPGMGVRFDRLTQESQTTLDTILEEKIRLQQSGVAPGSVAKAGAGMAVRRPSGAFATLDAQAGARPGGPPPIPVQVKMDSAIAPPGGAPAPVGAAPVSPMPSASARSGAHAAGAGSSIFSRPRTTSGAMRSVPVPSALFEPPTAADIDKALSVLEEKGGGPPPVMPAVAPTVVHRADAKAIGDDDPTRVFDSTSSDEFSQNEAITGKAEVLPESGVPIARDGEGELTERRLVDPGSGAVKSSKIVFDAMPPASSASSNGEAKTAEMPPPGSGSGPAATLDAPLASLVDSGSAPAAKPAAPPPMKPSASPPKSMPGVPMRITTDRPTATESGRFRSDTRYKKPRGKWVTWAVLLVVIGGAGAGGGWYVKRLRAKRAADALAAAAAAPPLAAGQIINNAPTPPSTGTEAPTPTGAAVAPSEATGAPEKTAPANPQEAVVPADKPVQSEKPVQAAKPEKAVEKESPAPSRRRRERAAAQTEAAGEKRPASEEAAKPDTSKPTEAAKPAEGEKTDKPAEGEKTAKPAEGEKAPEPAAITPMLKITSSPAGAEVVIDGIPRGTTPFSSKDITPDATHAITVKKDGFEAHERMISGSDWSRPRGGVQSLKFNVKLRKTGGEAAKPPAEAGEKKPEVEILTPSEP